MIDYTNDREVELLDEYIKEQLEGKIPKSNCCFATVKEDICQSCYEHCEVLKWIKNLKKKY
jgi:hypothetical protein